MNPQSQSLEVSKQPTGRDQAVKNRKLMAELVELKEEINKLKSLQANDSVQTSALKAHQGSSTRAAKDLEQENASLRAQLRF